VLAASNVPVLPPTPSSPPAPVWELNFEVLFAEHAAAASNAPANPNFVSVVFASMGK
jgi:hypothetical protein